MNTSPHNSEAERSLLGSILIDNAVLDDIELVPEDFYDRRNIHIAHAIRDLRAKDVAIDNITLLDQLAANGHEVEATYISDLTRSVPTSVHADSYFEIVDRMAVVRGLVKAGTDIVSTAYANADDPNKALDESEKILFSLSNRRRQVRWSDAADLMNMTKGRVKSIVVASTWSS